MRKYLLLVRVGHDSKALTIFQKIMPVLGSDTAKPLDLGYHCAVLFESSNEAPVLAKSISDHVYGESSFIITELGEDWAACNIQTKPEAWMRKHLKSHEFHGNSRSLRRG